MKDLDDISLMLNLLKEKLEYYKNDEIMLANVQGQLYALLWVIGEEPEEAWELIKRWRQQAQHH